MRGFSFLFFYILASTAIIQPIPAISQSPTPTLQQDVKISEVDLIHFGDIIDVDFAGGFEFDWRGHLSPEGNLDGFDTFAEPIAALCRSEQDVATDVERAYSRILRDPKVIVKIIDRSNRAVVQLDGAVKTPFRFQLRRAVNLRELIVSAGGFTDEASGEIEIFRPANLSCTRRAAALNASNSVPDSANAVGEHSNGSQHISIKIKDILAGNAAADPFILSGDMVTVLKAEPIYVMGAVNNPGPVNSHPGMTLTRVVDSAGGPAKGASLDRVVIFRRDGIETSVIPVDFEKVKSGEIDDVNIKAFDIIEVTFKSGSQQKYPPVITSRGNKQVNKAPLPLKIIE